jgi:5-methylcytosine-specific restriction enzyme A
MMKISWDYRAKNEMLADRQALILQEVAEGTGAAVGIEAVRAGVQTGLLLWFEDLGRARSPIVELLPKGLKRYEAKLRFGNFAAETIAQMRRAEDEEKQLARALVRSIGVKAEVEVSQQSLDDWEVRDRDFAIVASQKGVENRFGEEALTATCRALVIPMLGAMAELYGYDPVCLDETNEDAFLMEGAIRVSVVTRRERNPRNRLLCLRIHGHRCAICGRDPRGQYGQAGGIIEVHHIQPLSSSEGARPYSPETDLIPLCPNCHRAAHTRRPQPWTPEELRAMLNDNI